MIVIYLQIFQEKQHPLDSGLFDWSSFYKLTKNDVLEKALQKWRSVINIYIIAVVRCGEDVHVAL